MGLVVLTLFFHSVNEKQFHSALENIKIDKNVDLQIIDDYAKFPMSFEENLGQTHGSVKFLSRGYGYALFLTPNEFVLSLKNAKLGGEKNKNYSAKNDDEPFNSKVFRMKMLGANPSPKVSGQNKLMSKSNYFIGQDSSKWKRNIPNYGEVLYEDIYAGIDLVYYGNQQTLEYDFIVSPHVNPDIIELDFNNVITSKINQHGNLVLVNGESKISFKKPIIYQETNGNRNIIEGNYYYKGEKTIGFEIGDYDETKTLIIDPEVVYSTFLGGYDETYGYEIAVDASGHAYVTGKTASEDFPTTEGVLQPKLIKHWGDYGGWSDAFVTKLNAEGTGLVYSTFIGGRDGDDEGRAIALDAEGNVHITGITWSSGFPTKNAIQPRHADGGSADPSIMEYFGDVFVSKLNSDGSDLVFSTFLGDSENSDFGTDIAVDINGNVYVTGHTTPQSNVTENDIIFPTTSGAYSTTAPAWSSNGFVAKFTAAGGLVYSTYLRNEVGNYSIGTGIAADADGNAYIIGHGDLPVTTGAFNYDASSGGILVTKLNATGSALIYSAKIGPSYESLGSKEYEGAPGDIALDADGNVYITGRTIDGFPTTPGATRTIGEYGDFFVTKLNNTGSKLLYSTLIKGHHGVLGGGFAGAVWTIDYKAEGDITIDEAGIIYVTGSINDTQEFTIKEALQDTYGGGSWDAFILKIDPTKQGDASLLFSTYFGGDRNEEAHGIAVDQEGNIYITGQTNSKTYPITEQSFQNQMAWGAAQSAFVTKIGKKQNFLLYDQVITPPSTSPQQILPQYELKDKVDVVSLLFRGKPDDGRVALRVVNTSLLGGNSTPIKLKAEVLDTTGVPVIPVALIGDMGDGNIGFQFDVMQNGNYTIVVEAEDNSPGPFPAPFQIHLAGSIGQPKELIDGKLVKSRGIRKDILFNHVAPRPQVLTGKDKNIAQTGLFKFANPDSTSPFATAVLVPSSTFPKGLPPGKAYKRAPDPNRPLDKTTPTAKTSACSPGGNIAETVVDFTQLPDPPLSGNQSSMSETICAAIGKNDGINISLPMSNGVKSLIFDMGSGQEIVDGEGADFKIFAEGNYFVGVSNSPYYSPYTEFFIPLKGEVSGMQEFDLASARLSSARYVLITASSTVKVDAIMALHHFMDVFDTENGPVTSAKTATITMQRVKDQTNNLNPFLTLIGPEGLTFASVNGGYHNTAQYPDAAITNIELDKTGFYRFLANGYDVLPDNQAFGSFLVRLESGGTYDSNKISISAANEDSTVAQKTGSINMPRQRNSYLVDAKPGQHINIVVNAKNETLNPMVELFDPEGFLIAANDDAIDRERNSLISLNLPSNNFSTNQPLPNPSTYRVVVSAIDGAGTAQTFRNSKVHQRMVKGASYELKIFTGDLAINKPVEPVISNVFPAFSTADRTDYEMIINGYHFSHGATVAFSGTGITVKEVQFVHSNQLIVTIDIAQTALSGKRDIYVKNSNGAEASGIAFFEIVEGIGVIQLKWESPVSLDQFEPPQNLSSTSKVMSDIFTKYNDSEIFSQNNLSDLHAYNVYRSRSPNAKSTGKLIATIRSTELNFTDFVNERMVYFYQLTAVYDHGESEPSNETSTLITSVGNQITDIPIQFQLYQNYPNPFNPATEITYSIPEAVTFVSLIVYDAKGNEIKTLVRKKQYSGIHKVKWDGKNHEGKNVASGLYMVRLQAGSYSEVKKMLLLK